MHVLSIHGSAATRTAAEEELQRIIDNKGPTTARPNRLGSSLNLPAISQYFSESEEERAQRLKENEARDAAIQEQMDLRRRIDAWAGSGVQLRHSTAIRPMEEPFGVKHPIPSPKWEAILAKLLAGAEKREGGIFVLLGPRGTGKTLAAALAINAVCREGKLGLYTTAIRFFQSLRLAFRRGDDAPSEREALRPFATTSLLVIDELQERGHTEYEDRSLVNLIDRRYGDMRATILIANLLRDEFAKSVGASIMDRCFEGGGILDFSGIPSFRQAIRENAAKVVEA